MLRLLRRRVAPADHRVEHVEAEVPVGDVGHQRELVAALLEPALDVVGVVGVVAEVHAPLGPLDLGHVEVALLELLLARHLLLLDRHVERVDEGHALAAVGEQPVLGVARLAFAGIGLAAEARVALHHVAAVADELGHHERPGADRPLVQRQAVVVHARLRIEGIGLPRDRRHERHRHPVVPLRILALEADAQQVRIGRVGAFERPLAEVEEGLVADVARQPGQELLVLGLDQLAVGLEAEHVLGEDRVHRRLDAGGGVALDRVDEVVGDQLARALLLEVPGRALVAELGPGQVVIEVLALERSSRTPDAART